ncbi:MAG: hypothetical protein JW943_08255 [Deltaproteobacteria bacterium]|nr:hypothetical protein [Deltaproteobacteria bacterium]
MALEFLRRAIFDETAALKSPRSEVLARTFYLVLSPSMGHLQDWFHEWFPDCDEAIRCVHPWYIADKGSGRDKIKEHLKSMFLAAFGVDTANRLLNRGYRISNTATQVILVGDLTEEGVDSYMESVCSTFKEIIAEFGNHESPIFFTGLLLCRNLVKDAAENICTKTCGNIDDKLKLIKDKFDRLFLIDISNTKGVIVSNETDMHFLVGQLLYILSKKPLEFTAALRPAAFGEWLRRVRPRDNRCSGFSGISILNPIDQMLETLLIAKGGEILNGAFFGGIDEDKVDFYVKSLINKTHLNSQDVFSKMLKENKDAPLIDPLKNLEAAGASWEMNRPDEFTSYIDYLDARLPGAAEENGKIMTGLGQLLLDNFRYELRDHLNGAISNETGGLLIAEKLLAKLKELITGMIPKEAPDQPFPDISNLINKLAALCAKGPRKEAVLVRGAMLCLAIFAGIFGSQAMFDFPFFVFPLFALLAAVGVATYWFSSKKQVDSLVSDIWQNLFEKWNILMGKEYSAIFTALLPQYISIIDELAARVQESQKRLHKVVAFFSDKYVAALPEHSAFWRYAVNNREDFMKYLPQLQTNMPDIAAAYLKEDRPLELWNRTAPLDAAELNEWEWSLGERMGLRLLPMAKNIIDLSVSQLLNDSDDQTKAFLELLKSAAQPFLSLKPSAEHCIPQAVVEMPEEGSDGIYQQIENAIRGSFQSMERKSSMSPYRISLFSFADSVGIDSLKAGG